MSLKRAISFEIRMLANLVKRSMETSAVNDGQETTTGLQGWIIGYLVNNADREIFQRDIEKEFDIRRATVTGILQLMERDGLIERKSVERDARLKKIILTDKAKRIHEVNYQRFVEFEKKLQAKLTTEELDTFCSIVEKLKKNLE